MRKLSLFIILILTVFMSSCKDTGYAPYFQGPLDISVEVNDESFILLDLMSAKDYEDGTIDITLDNINSGDFDITKTGLYTITYNIIDSDQNEVSTTLTIKVEDNIPPNITLNGDVVIYVVENGRFVDPLVTCSDNYNHETKTVINDATFDITKPGNYTIKYKCDDGHNTSQEISRVVHVLEEQNYTLNVGDKVYLSGYYALDERGHEQKIDTGIYYVSEIKNAMTYPIGLSLEMNGETIIFSSETYLRHESDFILGDNVKLDVMLLHQFDYNGYLNGSSVNTISSAGCALTALTMIVNYWNETTLTPEDTNPDLVEGGLVYWNNTNVEEYNYLVPNYYPSYSHYSSFRQTFTNTDKYKELKFHIKEKLDLGLPVMISLEGNTTHYVVAYGYGYTNDGEMYIKINDPGSSYRFYLNDVIVKYPYFYEGIIVYTQ